jgi:molybdopterin-guanine dinucleotide biosynthesis protein A
MREPPPLPPLYGLVLAGGRSRRMGRDKAALAYQGGVPHVRRTAALLSETCGRVFVSCRADQAADPLLDGLEQIPDAFAVGGPLNGILSAQAAHPGAAFLVAACDLPFLSSEALRALAAARDPAAPATAYENPARDGAIEPLCAIYEPGLADAARTLMAAGLTCPTKILNGLDTRRLAPADALFLANANTPEDYEKAFVPTVTVEYFAIFRALAKRPAEEWPLRESSLPRIYDALRARHGFPLGRDSVHVAINDAYASWDAVLAPGDRLAFIPPVSGG